MRGTRRWLFCAIVTLAFALRLGYALATSSFSISSCTLYTAKTPTWYRLKMKQRRFEAHFLERLQRFSYRIKKIVAHAMEHV